MGRVTELLGAKGPQVVTFFLPTAHGPSGRLFLRAESDCLLWTLTPLSPAVGKVTAGRGVHAQRGERVRLRQVQVR